MNMIHSRKPYAQGSISRAYRFEDIERIVCEYYDTPVQGLYEKCKRRDVALCRQLIAFFSMEFLPISSIEIGKRIGRSHAIVLYSKQVIQDYIDTDEIIRQDVYTIRKMIVDSRIKRIEQKTNN